VIQKNERGVYVMLETETGGQVVTASCCAAPAAKPRLRLPESGRPRRRRKPAAPQRLLPAKPAEHKTLGQKPESSVIQAFDLRGVTDTGPLPARLSNRRLRDLKRSAAAKQRAEEGGGSEPAAAACALRGCTRCGGETAAALPLH
jgi:hypothetical protein